MKLELLYFAQLRESFGIQQEELECQVDTVQDLIHHLSLRGGRWKEELTGDQPLKVAVDQQMVSPSFMLRSGSEVAFFRPVTGG